MAASLVIVSPFIIEPRYRNTILDEPFGDWQDRRDARAVMSHGIFEPKADVSFRPNLA